MLKMGDSDGSESKSIPSWQLPKSSDTSGSTEAQQIQPSPDSIPDSRASLIEKASRFLDDDEIREASKERKAYFLQTKGLTDPEIEKLLAEKNRAAQMEVVKGTEGGGEASTASNKAATEAQSTHADITDDYIESEPTPSQKHDGPPIITYPEFLLHSQKPPPLITTGRLLTAFNLTAGAVATMYGLRNFVVEPMVESLSSARHSFFETASLNIDKLNGKLESTVSKIPGSLQGGQEDSEDTFDGDSESSDPSRFFSRTIATQTSPHLSRSSSSISLPDNKASPPSTVATHTSQISRIHELLCDLKDENREVSDSVKDNVQGLMEYLNNLPSWGRTGQTGAKMAPSRNHDDSVAKVKAEIKSVKGTLLSARNFPAGVTTSR